MAADHCLLMRLSLQQAPPSPLWPPGVTLRLFERADAAQVYALLLDGQADDVLDWPTWQSQWLSNAEYDPALCLLVMDSDGLVAMVQGWTSGYLKDLVVHPRARRRGLGSALLAWTMQRYCQRGEASVDLRVREDNHPALQLYQRMGWRCLRREPC
jgi:ribosomal protein S18 acetylase RimI-like enzyme